MVRFPADETGKQRKLSWPWHGPYRVRDPDIVVSKVYFPRKESINVHFQPVAIGMATNSTVMVGYPSGWRDCQRMIVRSNLVVRMSAVMIQQQLSSVIKIIF